MDASRRKLSFLQFLVRGCLPEESGATPALSDLSFIISKVKTVGLLSEQLPNPSNTKLVEAWRAAMDAWLERVISLTSSKMPDKCWVGVSLLGVTCGECSSARFITSYSVWFQKLLAIIQLPPNSDFARVAVCASLSDLFTRLALFSKLKKDGRAFAGKVVPPIIKLLNENGSDVVLEEVLTLLCTILKLFPSLHGLYDNVQAALVAKIVPSIFNTDLLKKIMSCLTLLPMAKADEDSWSLMMQQIIMEIDILLNDGLQGLGEKKSSSIVRLLIPPGRHPPSQLGILSSLNKVTEQSKERFLKLVVPTIVTLMQCCCMMLTNHYPVQVIVPISPLVALVQRVLIVDGSSHDSLTRFTTIIDEDLVCHDPTLHLGGMDLLIAVIERVKSQLIPHAATVARILMEYSKRDILPSQRIKLYSVMDSLLISMGTRMAWYLAPELINNASADLNDHPGSNTYLSNQHLSVEFDQSMTQNNPRKRKHFSESTMQLQNGTSKQSVTISIKPSTPLSVKTAALKALEALLTAGGSLKSESWRSDVNILLITVAKNAFDMGWANEGKSSLVELESTTFLFDFQLATLSALLTSLKSMSHVRPPHLSEALEIFHRGKLEAGPILAAVCGNALLDLETIIHPQALPLIHIEDSMLKACNQRYQGNTFYSGHPNPKTSSFPIENIGATNNMDNNDGDDELLNGWLRSHKEERLVQFSNTNGQPLDGPGKVEEVNAQTIVTGHENKASGESDVVVHVVPRDEMEIDNNNLIISNIINGERPSSSGAPEIVGRVSENIIMVDTLKSLDVPDMGKQLQIGTASSENATLTDVYEDTDVLDKQRELVSMYDSDTVSLDSLPRIVDADPDSDY
ncbi:uncharacterized protein LOC141835144 [Curcuma longa]|uniref:uncharacterized protein LOC141835144 n=1 Tax=Curcuma longa TaxID=136217 RepID=UPI003D9FACB7